MSESSKRARADDEADAGVSNKAMKWAEEFDALEEDDQYTYLEEIAPRMTKMHLQFLHGIIGFEDGGEDDEDDDGEEEYDEDGEEEYGDGEEGEEGEEDAGA